MKVLTQPSFNRRTVAAAFAAAVLVGLTAPAALAQEPIKVGLVAALSGGAAKTGEGIPRGRPVAVDKINAAGGILGRKLELVRRDDESNPSKGQVAARELIDQEKVAVMFGGIDSPVALAIVPIANKEKVPFFSVWAAATPITRNGANPNFVFRVSAVDVLVDNALVQYAAQKYSARRPGMLLINNPWGESNEKGLTEAITGMQLRAAGVEKFEPNDVDMVPQLARLKAAQ